VNTQAPELGLVGAWPSNAL